MKRLIWLPLVLLLFSATFAGIFVGPVKLSEDEVEAYIYDSDAETMPGILTFSAGPIIQDNVEVNYGTGSDAACEWNTQDANAEALICTGPEGTAALVPGFVWGDHTADKDLTFFNGITEPFIGLIDDAGTSYVRFGWSAAATPEIDVGGTAAGTAINFPDGLNTDGSATPSVILKDSDAAGTDEADEYAFHLEADMTTTTEDGEISDVTFYAYQAGAKTAFITHDGSAVSTTITGDAVLTDSTITGGIPAIVGQGYTQTSHGDASTADITGGSITLGDGYFVEGRTLKFTVGGTVTGATDTISAILYFEDGAVMTLTTADGAAGDWIAEFTIVGVDATNQRIIGKLWAEAGAETIIDYATDNTDTGAAGTIPAKVQMALASGDDTITSEYVRIEAWYKTD